VARSTYQLSIPSSTRYLEKVRRFVETHTVEAGFSLESVEQFKVAVDEACTNVIKHAYSGDETRVLDISVILEGNQCTIRIRDDGYSFKPSEYAEPNIFELAKKRHAGGFGVHIMRRLMDRVEYEYDDGINEVRLIKFLDKKSAQNGA